MKELQVPIDASKASYHADVLKQLARKEKVQYKKRELFDAAAYLDSLTNYHEDEITSGCTDD